MKFSSLLFLHLVDSVRATTIDTPNVYKNNCTNPIVFNDLPIPSIINLVKEGFGKGFDVQERIIFNGTILEQPDQFKINLAEDGVMYQTANQTANIQLHFNPRFQFKQVVRNTWIKNIGWGREDISGGFPFKAGEPFILEFVAIPRDVIYISVNNKFFAYFRSYTLSQISQIYVFGENTVRINSLTLCPNALKVRELPSTEAPTTPYPRCPKTIDLHNVQVPSTIDLVKIGFGKGLKVPTRMIFKGVPLQGTTEFKIIFGEDGIMYKTANVPFHFNPRFQPGLVLHIFLHLVLKVKFEVFMHSWTVENGMRREIGFRNPFRAGEPFILEFVATPRDPIMAIFYFI
uniref:Galectin n=1 Tax=Meloidogyne enterolobii TaxID=390850 RepID=A0A6V7UDU2_MELEN|nr:unnamed protein product [Meloidogyne enterolobii]